MRIIQRQSWHVGDAYGHKAAPKDRPTFKYRDPAHTPYNKRHGEVKSLGLLSVEDFKGSDTATPWTRIELEEITTGAQGRTSSRTIALTLRGDARDTLRRMLAADEWTEPFEQFQGDPL
jgi:hypothetical protein